MKKLMIALLFVSAPAWAEWTLVRSNEDFDAYADLATVRKDGNTVQMWTLADLKTSHQIEGITFLSGKTQYEFDCNEKRIKILSLTAHSRNMGAEEPVYSNASPQQWEPVPAGSIVESIWMIACKP